MKAAEVALVASLHGAPITSCFTSSAVSAWISAVDAVVAGLPDAVSIRLISS